MRRFLRNIMKTVLTVIVCIWAFMRFGFSRTELFAFVFGFYVVLSVCAVMPSARRREKLQRLGGEQGIYSDAYVESLLKVMRKEDIGDRVPFYISLIAVRIGRGEFDDAQKAITALPIDWPKRFAYKLLNKEMMRIRAVLYFNNAIVCYYYMENQEKADAYYHAGREYIDDYLENGQNRNVKSAIKETMASYAELHGDDDRALQLLDEMENTNNMESFCSSAVLRARIYIKRGSYEEAKALLENIVGKNENPLLNQKAEEMLENIKASH